MPKNRTVTEKFMSDVTMLVAALEDFELPEAAGKLRDDVWSYLCEKADKIEHRDNWQERRANRARG